MDTEQVTFGEIKLSQVQVYFEGAHIGRLERAGGYDENLDFWGLSDKLVERYGRGHDVQTKGLDTVKRWAWALEMDHQRQGQKEKDMQARPQKKTWSFLWDDRAGETGPLSRKRVAELLRAARSRGDQITRPPQGYAIGSALRVVRQGSQIEKERPQKRHAWRYTELPPSGVHVCVDCPARYNRGEAQPQDGCPGEAGWGPIR